MFLSCSDIESIISNNVNITSFVVESFKDNYKIDFDTVNYSHSLLVQKDDNLDANLNKILSNVDFISKYNSTLKDKSILDITFSYSQQSNVVLNDFKDITINLCDRDIDMFIIKNKNSAILDEFSNCLNILDLLCVIEKYDLLNYNLKNCKFKPLLSGMYNIDDILAIARSNKKGKIQTKIVCLLEEISILALLEIKISLSTKGIIINAIDDKMLDTDTGNTIEDRDSVEFILYRIYKHIYNNIK